MYFIVDICVTERKQYWGNILYLYTIQFKHLKVYERKY